MSRTSKIVVVAAVARSGVMLFSLSAAAAALTAIGCGGGGSQSPAAGAASTSTARTGLFSAPHQGGAELWQDNCNRCHNAPAPTTFSAGEWDLIMNHMRLRANLTGQETRAIAEFLKAGS